MNKEAIHQIEMLIVAQLTSMGGEITDLFLGGSQRFGWTTPESDIDLFLETADGRALFRKAVTSRLYHVDYTPIQLYPNTALSTTVFNQKVHVILLDAIQFPALRVQHESVDNYLKEYPGVVSIVKSLREYVSISGTTIYRIILDRISSPPGSQRALELGCTCPVLDNEYGVGYMGIPGKYVYTVGCPIH